MKSIFNFLIQLLVIMLVSTNVRSAELNFGTTVYFTAPDSTTLPGTVLTSSGSTLSGFDFSTAPATHAIFTSGIYFPVTDCQNHNIWVRFRHVAADPNGRNYGINIAATTGLALYGGPLMIGGFTGFLYQIDIFRDQNLTGSRANILGPLYPTTVTVASLETLAFPQGPHEWLCFQIQDANSSGWNLNSINFTGTNPNSHPGFSPRPVEVTPGNQATYVPKFSENFPTGRDSIYAITLPIGGYSEFKMTANQVSRFQYGYEFSSFGYQGMSMAFGEAPILKDSVVFNLCYGDMNAAIYIKPSGNGPYTYLWNTGQTTQNLTNLPSDDYSVTVTDVNQCTATLSRTIPLPSPFEVYINPTVVSPDSVSMAVVWTNGGTGPLKYLWSNGDTTEISGTNTNGNFEVVVTDANGCVATSSVVVSQIVGVSDLLKDRVFSLFPIPFSDELNVMGLGESDQISISNLQGKEFDLEVTEQRTTGFRFDTRHLPAGMYVIRWRTEKGEKWLKAMKK